ncbi:MAG: thioredoxin domain-containing protein [Campylobacterota bacterium]
MSNRLAHEDSPYLQQHKDNPFDWYPWCDEAFERARSENRPIFISIGYSSCHWCHVMEREVFENDAIAEFVNRHFICIKVDREERPDIDKHYQELHMLLNRRSGGWPLSVFCTPGNKPFYAATYIPPYNRDRMMGFSELSEIIAAKVAENDEKLFANADEIASFLRPDDTPPQATPLTEKIAQLYLKQARHNFDETNGGFSAAPKFPHVSTLRTLLRLERLYGDPIPGEMVRRSLHQMALGGMYDLIDGGFCRYSTDASWLVPHFEKMTYDNALLCALYAEAAEVYGEPRFMAVAREIADFMMAFMSEQDLFYSASDADSDGEEGKYFVYAYDEILDALHACGVADPEHAAHLIGPGPEGNFEGHCIVRLASPERPEWFDAVRGYLASLRKGRNYPFVDRKVITAWNAMMIRALFVLGRTEERYLSQAKRSLEKLLASMGEGDLFKHSALIGKTAKIDGFLEDYAYLCAALLEGYRTTLYEPYLVDAQRYANKALELFYREGKWYFSRGAFTTEAELDDGTYPGSMAVMVEALMDLGTLIDPKYRRFAFKSLEFASLKLMKTPIYFPTLTLQAIRWLHPDRLVKGPAHRLTALEKAPVYPFVLYRNDETLSAYLVCGENACYETTADAASLDGIIRSTL